MLVFSQRFIRKESILKLDFAGWRIYPLILVHLSLLVVHAPEGLVKHHIGCHLLGESLSESLVCHEIFGLSY